MDKNVGRMDAGIRLVLGIVLIGVALVLSGNLVISLLAALGSIAMIGSAITGACPFYALIGCSTYHRSAPPHPDAPRH